MAETHSGSTPPIRTQTTSVESESPVDSNTQFSSEGAPSVGSKRKHAHDSSGIIQRIVWCSSNHSIFASDMLEDSDPDNIFMDDALLEALIYMLEGSDLEELFTGCDFQSPAVTELFVLEMMMLRKLEAAFYFIPQLRSANPDGATCDEASSRVGTVFGLCSINMRVDLIFGVVKMSQLLDKAKNYVSDKIANMPKPEASVTDVDFKRVGRDGLQFLAKVSVSNPYSTPLPICEIKYSLKSASREIASGTIPDPGSLKASDTTMLDVPVKVPHSILLSLARDIGADWDIDYQLDLGLIIDLPVIGNITIPLSQKGEIKLPTLSSMFTG
ncbi:hypothetical protein VNO78_15243 [Psophocarpus tetragonolobus]|uniref:Water stress and hypersensitive response domain-containing protein n=1 Tax=Psophocarpus tetragonolobus TaxID=3891 RepID=A0AAN9XJR2_PSOTE